MINIVVQDLTDTENWNLTDRATFLLASIEARLGFEEKLEIDEEILSEQMSKFLKENGLED